MLRDNSMEEFNMDLQSTAFDQRYIATMRPIFNKAALFSDTTSNYVFPPEPELFSAVRIRFRTARNNVDYVFLVNEGMSYPMHKVQNGNIFDYYELTVHLKDKKYRYCFRLQLGNINCYYDCRGVVREPSDYCSFVIIPGFKTPGWAQNAIMYQIMTDRFCNGDQTNDVLDREYYYLGGHVKRVPADQWNKYPDKSGFREFYGGDLQGVLDKMDYLQDLGIQVIYFNPLFVSPSNHKYDTQDYDYIDPHFGKFVSESGAVLEEGQTDNKTASRYISRVTDLRNLEAANAMFARVVEEAHKRGIRVIIDGVFNHCGSFHKWMDRERIYENAQGYEKGAFLSGESRYRDYFRFKDKSKWPFNQTYEGWWGHETLPKLNFEESEELYEYILRIGEKWVSAPFHADGWRLDVAADLGTGPEFNHHFWAEFRARVKKANPDAVILAEHYGDPSSWLQGDQWDSVMNYDAFMEPVTWFLTGMEKHSDDFRPDMLGNAEAFWNAMEYNSARMPGPSVWTSMNELSNHDHSRFLTRTNHVKGRSETLGPEAADAGVNKAVMREAVVMQMTWPGAATVYYGDEAGLCGFTDPDNRRAYPWGREDMQMIAFHKALIRLHNQREEFRKGSLKKIAGEYNYLAYGRFTEHSQSVVLINNNDHEITELVPVWVTGVPKETVMHRLICSNMDGFQEKEYFYKVTAGKISVRLPAFSAEIIGYEFLK